MFFYILAIIGWILLISLVILVARWNDFVNRNRHAQQILRNSLYISAIIRWILIISVTFIVARWNNFVNRNPNAQGIISQIIIKAIFENLFQKHNKTGVKN